MKKFLLVIIIGLVITLDIFGVVKNFMVEDEIEEINHIENTTMTVYME